MDEKHKQFIITELAKLDGMNWYKDDKISDTIFPYVLIEAINILLNSRYVDTITDYCANSYDANAMLERVLNNKFVDTSQK